MVRRQLYIMAIDRLASPRDERLAKHRAMVTFAKKHNISGLEFSEIKTKAERAIKERSWYEWHKGYNPECYVGSYE